MLYTVEIQRTFIAVQGLKSPVRAQRGLPPLVTDEGFSVILRVGIAFDEDQLKEQGWFVDTDAVENVVEECCKYLSSDTWTNLFEFRPTFELVARQVFQQLEDVVDQLSYVELENSTIGVRTRLQRELRPIV